MEKPDVIRDVLAQAIGTTQYWKVFPGNNDFKITDGVKVMFEMCDAFWLVTAIFFETCNAKIKDEEFVVWRLEIKADRSALLIGEDGNGGELLREEFFYTDFPLKEGIKLYWCDNVLMLPSEY